jgi:Fur family ferric uptake transcriptional regulator
MPRDTRQKDCLRHILEEAERPLTPAELLKRAKRKLPGIGLATVYRFLRTMVDTGEARQVIVPGHAPCYERGHLHHHHHLLCRGCGSVFETEGCLPGLERLAPKGFRVESHEIFLYGLCKKCATS